MRRIWIVAGLVFTVAASAAVYQRGSNWKEFHYVGSRLMVDLAHPDALIRTNSLAALPRDLLKVPMAHDVLTEDLAFYYEQQEDRLGINGAIKRIAYEHKLGWTDRLLSSALNEPAELALWRDGKGALRHYALVMRRNMLAKVLQEAAQVAMKDNQLSLAGEIDTGAGKATVLALAVNPRRTLLLISQGDRVVVLSDPGLLFNAQDQMVAQASAAIVEWLKNDGTLAHQFALDAAPDAAGSAAKADLTRPAHTLVVGAPTLALGYGAFLSGFKGLRFDFGQQQWSTSVWLAPQKTGDAALGAAALGDATLWRAAPANASACVVLPVDWNATQRVFNEATKKPVLADTSLLAAFSGPVLACWYDESNLYAPVFIGHLTDRSAKRDASLQALANWALATAPDKAAPAALVEKPSKDAKAKAKTADETLLWHNANGTAAVGARGGYVSFSPDAALVDKVLSTVARTNPSVADQLPTSNGTLALMTPRPLSSMAEREVLRALGGAGDANLLAAAQTHLPARMKALANYPAYKLELPSQSPAPENEWHRVEWVAQGAAK